MLKNNLNNEFEFEVIIKKQFPQLLDNSNSKTIEKLNQIKREFFISDKKDQTKYYPTPKFRNYLEHKISFEEFSNNLKELKEKAGLQNSDAMNELVFSGRNYIQKRDNSLTRWKIIGNKEAIDNQLNSIIKS
jgi:hypothetical protein